MSSFLFFVLFFSCVPTGKCTSVTPSGGVVIGCDDIDDSADIDDTGDSGTGPVDADGDGHASTETGGDDCDDTDVTVYPGADEACNGMDDDCDGTIDEDLELVEYFADADSDGYGSGVATSLCEDPGSGYSTSGDDCDDTDPSVHPNAIEDCATALDLNCDGFAGTSDNDGDGTIACEDCDDGEVLAFPGNPEVCDGIDNDCDGTTDEDATDAFTWYADSDGDGYGDPDTTDTACDAPTGYVADATDCDDREFLVNPDGIEVCDSADTDEDCSGVAEDATTGLTTWHPDADSDGYGSAEGTVDACDAPSGYITTAAGDEDCDDSDPAVNVGATEACNEIDDDCDGDINESGATGESTWYADSDGDGYGDSASAKLSCTQTEGYVGNSSDCDDADVAINPGETEACDGIDNDCSGSADDGILYDIWYADSDGDGYGDPASSTDTCDGAAPDGFTANNTDCDDTDASVSPGATEIVSDGIDQDCDGADSTEPDADGDGEGDSSDCNDADVTVYTGATETCDGVDEDCDGSADDGLAYGDWYEDADGDGYGDASIGYSTCDGAPSGTVSDDTDCDDSDAGINPGATESCDGDDTDCDGDVDESGATGESTWYADSDGDGYGDASVSQDACDQPSGYEADSDDCDDGDDEVNPGAAELCDSIDNDCDGGTDDETVLMCADNDGDGYGNPESCTAPLSCSESAVYFSWGYTDNADDSDDGDASVH